MVCPVRLKANASDAKVRAVRTPATSNPVTLVVATTAARITIIATAKSHVDVSGHEIRCGLLGRCVCFGRRRWSRLFIRICLQIGRRLNREAIDLVRAPAAVRIAG
jgi:hypothetical protein